MLKISTKRYFKILEELSKLEEKYNIHFKETSGEFILEKKDMYDMSWEAEDAKN